MRSGGNVILHRDSRGFTLVELMVALGLAAVISVSIMFISSQARLTYEETIKRVDIYNRFRYVLYELEKDMKAWIPTSDLEFFTDGRGSGSKTNSHWDPGEEVPDKRDERGTGVVDGGVRRDFDEYAQIIQRHYISKEPFQAEEKVHDAYQMYFRTLTYVDGAVREANVEYMLVDPSKVVDGMPQPPERVEPAGVSDLALYKVVRYFDIKPADIMNRNVTPVVRKVLEVCTNVTDFRIEYLVDRRQGSKSAPTFRTPEEEYRSFAEDVTRPRRDDKLGPRGGYRKIFGYGSTKLSEKFPLAIGYRARRGDDQLRRTGAEHLPVRFGFRGVKEIGFAELTPGDQIFVFSASSRVVQASATAQGGVNQSRLIQFPTGDYTIQTNVNGELEFEEDIDSTLWQNDSQSGLYYKAAFLPAAIRITLRVVDDKGENPKTLQREVWPRRRSR